MIPRGFLYDYITCPNYFGELIEWLGFFICTQTSGGILFVIFSFANLFPRALSHHRWYQEKFDEYPKKRKAIFPFLI